MADTTYFRLGLAFDQQGASAVDKAMEEFQQRQIQRGEQYAMASEAQSKRILEARRTQLIAEEELQQQHNEAIVDSYKKREADIARARADAHVQSMKWQEATEKFNTYGDPRAGTSERARKQGAVERVKYETEATRLIYEAEQQRLRATAAAQEAGARVEHRLRADRLQSARIALSEEARLEENLANIKARAAASAQQADASARNQRLANARNVLSELGRNEQELTRIQLAAAQERARIQSGTLSPNNRSHFLSSNAGGRGQGWDFLGGQSFRTIGFQLRAIPGGGIAETMGRLAPLADVMTELATGTGTASAGVLGLVGGLVAFGVVTNAVINDVAKLTERYKEQAKALAEGERVALGGGPEIERLEQRRTMLAELGVETTLRERRRLEAQEANRRANTYLAMGPLMLADIEGARQASVAASGANQVYEEQNKKVEDLEAKLRGLNETYTDTENQVGAIINAEIRLSEERQAQWQRDMETEEARLAAMQEITDIMRDPNMTSEAARDILKDRQQEAAGINSLITSREEMLQQYQDELSELEAIDGPRFDQITRMIELRGQIDILKDDLAEWRAELSRIEPYLSQLPRIIGHLFSQEMVDDAREAGREIQLTLEGIWERARELAASARESGLSAQTDQLFTEQTNLGEALERVREATEAYDEALAEHGERLADIDAEAQEKREEAQTDAAEDFAEAEQDAQKKREEQEKEHRDRIAEINRRADRDIANAIGNRDALAAYLAEQKRQDELADEAARNKDQLEQIEEAYDDQKKAIQKRLDDQLESIEKAAAKARATEQRRYADQARDLQAAIDKERSMVQLAEARLQQIRTGYQETRVISEVNWYATLDNVANSYQSAILFRWQYFWGALLGGMPASPAQGGTPDHGTPWGGWAGQGGAATLDRRIDQRIGMTLGGR